MRDYDISIPDVEADRDQLIQVILNVVRNAAQALTENAIHQPRIIMRSRVSRQFTIGSTRHKLVLHIDIIDNGPGIPRDMLESIFYPLITGRAQGTGLGLSIAQGIVASLDGLIECESQPGETCFTVLIPIIKRRS